jgi:glycosyltransferase involved in cell wall biosynthesis
MNIIAISNRIPAENKRGDQSVSFHRLIYLAILGHSIDLVCFQSENLKDDDKAKKILEKKKIRVHFIKFNIFEAIINLLKSFFSNDLPLQSTFFKSKEFTKRIRILHKDKKIDFIYCVMIRVAPNINWYNGKLILEMVDSMGLNFLRRFHIAKGFKKWIFKREQIKVSNYEKSLADRSYRSFVVSSIDQKKINSRKVQVAPLGVKIFNKFRKTVKKPIIVFSGNMFYQPNIDAITWFVKYCWSNILIQLPKAEFLIVGSNPTLEITAIEKKYPSIKVTGRVNSVFEVLNKASVSIAPMQSGSGMQFKILEAMACAVPVVCTSIGIGDIKAIEDKDVIVTDTPNDFAQKVVDIVKSQRQNDRIGKNGQLYVYKNHNWKKLNEKFVDLCDLKKINLN